MNRVKSFIWITLAGLLLLGGVYLIIPDAYQEYAGLLFVIWLAVMAVITTLLVIGGGGIILYGLWLKAQRQNYISPDEHGNLPVLVSRRGHVNLNLIGAEQNPQAWSLHQLTNNFGVGSQPREILQGLSRPISPPPPRTISEAEAPPILIEARKQGQGL